MSFSDKLICTKEDSFCETLYIPNHKPNLARLLDIVILPEVLDYIVVTTIQGLSFEGQHLTGLKLIANISFSIKISYMSSTAEHTIHSIHYNHLKSLSFNIPTQFHDKDVYTLIDEKRITLSPLITSISTQSVDPRYIHTYITLLANVFIS